MYVVNHDKHDIVGLIDFHRSHIAAKPIDGWFQLRKPVQQTEPHGEIGVSLLLSSTSTGLDHLTVTVNGARDILSKSVATKVDPAVVVTLDGQKYTTNRVKNDRYPIFDSSFTFERAKLPPCVLVQLQDGSTVLGEAEVSLAGLQRDIVQTGWHRMMPSAASIEKYTGGSGSIRVAAQLVQDLILPLGCYSSLLTLLEDNCTSVEGVNTGVVALLEELLVDPEFVYVDREQVALTLVRILLHRHCCIKFLNALNSHEITMCRESATLFRGNSMASKCTDQFMKIVGLPYLHDTLKQVIDRIFREKKNCEINPHHLISKKGSEKDIERNVEVLTGYLREIFASIFSSVDNCPPAMRVVFKSLQESARKNRALSKDTAFTVVSSFLFLRFFAPAVLSPKLFGMRGELGDATTSRTLTLLAKALMSVANLGPSVDIGKQDYMKPLYPVIKENLPALKSFIDEICAIEDAEESTLVARGSAPSPGGGWLAAEGELLVRAATQESSVLSRTFKKRYVTLTREGLRLSKSEESGGGQTFDAGRFEFVEQAETASFDKKLVIMISIAGEDTILLVMPTRQELHIWLAAFRKVCAAVSAGVVGHRRRQVYYPYLSDKPGKKKGSAQPCAKIHGSVIVDPFADNPPPEVWAHKLFASLLAGKQLLEARYGSSGTASEKKVTYDKVIAILDDIHLAHLLHQDQD